MGKNTSNSKTGETSKLNRSGEKSKNFSEAKRDAEEFAMLMQQAKTQSELHSIVAKMQKFEAEKKEQTVAVSNLEKELSDRLTNEDVDRRAKLHLGLESQAALYDSGSKAQPEDTLSGPNKTDLYKHDEMYKGDEYISSDDVKYAHDKNKDNPNINRDEFKSDVEKMIEKNTAIYKR